MKFRAWDTANKEMYQVRTLTWDRWMRVAEGQDAIMQFTGLLDRHGTEIYEGDVVTDDGVLFWEVWYEAPQFKLRCGNRIRHLSFAHEVRGHIYANPELVTP